MKPGRNDPCPCGSGKKYKKCHLPKEEHNAAVVRESMARGRETGFATSMPDDKPAPSPEQVASWPLRKAWVPVPEIFAATGFGVAGVLREQGPGAFVNAFFLLRLSEGGLYGMTHKECVRPEDADEFLASTAEQLCPGQPGDPGLAATLLWACHDYALEVGDPFPPQSLVSLALLPRVSPAPLSLEDIAGRGRSVPRALVEMVRAHPVTDVGAGQEIAVLTEVRLGLADPAASVAALRGMTPDFDARAEGLFDFTRPSLAHHTAPMSRFRDRRIQGEVRIEGDALRARSGLSMMVSLLGKLFATLPQRPVLRGVRWASPTLRRQWEWDAATEPLALG